MTDGVPFKSGALAITEKTGLDCEKQYIAAQGPFTPDTINDFWRMVLQYNCSKIVMLTNLDENGVMKCKKYWPEVEDVYGYIHVKKMQEDVETTFTTRRFAISTRDGDHADVVQYHFTVWPDKGVPTCVSSLLAFRQKVIEEEIGKDAPIIVHCSAGIGRTGTFMALDYLLKQGRRDGYVDVINCVSKMRQQRVNVVQTKEQYEYLHDAISEALTGKRNTVHVNEFPEYYKKLKDMDANNNKTNIDLQFELIEQILPPMSKEMFQTGNQHCNKSKNRHSNIIAADEFRLFIQGQDGDYINAIEVLGQETSNTYILTQTPLPNTTEDFLQLAMEQEVSTIVMMDSKPTEENVGVYWPLDESVVVVGHFEVCLLNKDSTNENFDVLSLKVLDQKRKDETILKLFKCSFWEDRITSPGHGELLEIIENVFTWQSEKCYPPILVHCMNGALKSGLFCTVATVVERIKRDHVIDVLQTVLHIRSRRPQAMSQKEDLAYCYEAARKYIEIMNNSANIKTPDAF